MDNITQRTGVIYRYECDDEYVGESARAFEERLKEYFRAPSPSMAMPTSQVIIPVWTISPLCIGNHTTLLEPSWKLKVNDPSLTRNNGKYQLSCIWGEVLLNTPVLQLKQTPTSPGAHYTWPTPQAGKGGIAISHIVSIHHITG